MGDGAGKANLTDFGNQVNQKAGLGRMHSMRVDSGSRFSTLNDLMDEEGDKAGEMKMETTDERGVNVAPKVTERVNKGKEPLVG